MVCNIYRYYIYIQNVLVFHQKSKLNAVKFKVLMKQKVKKISENIKTFSKMHMH